jgi:hypothetical protein
MAKINVRIPEPKTEYDVSNQKQINRSIALIVEQLNSTFLKRFKRRYRTIYLVWIRIKNGKYI